MSADPSAGSAGVPSPIVPPTVPAVPPAGADTTTAPEAPLTSRIALRVSLLIVLTVAVNAWVLLKFGIKLGSFFIVELTVAAAAALTKLLTPKDNEAVQKALRKFFYGLLSYPFLIAGYIVLGVVMLNSSKIVALFAPPPAVLVRVPYPHSALDGGVIEVRDERGKLIASAETSGDSASLLLGRNVTIAPNPSWDGDLPGQTPVTMAKVRGRWSRALHPREPISLTAHQKLTAVFRTDAQRAADPNGIRPENNDGMADITVAGGDAVQDVILRRPR